MTLQELYIKALTPHGLSADDAPPLLHGLEERPWEAMALAGRIRERKYSDRVDPCSIINAKSGNCSEDCAFCAQSAHHDTDARTYPLLPERDIVEAARKAHSHGVRRFCIVTSGRGIYTGDELASIARCVEKIRGIGISPCATLGTLTPAQFRALKDAGLHRYHHNIETSRSFFGRICTTHDYDERIETLKAAKEAGLSLCSGGILGMGESMADRAEMALALKAIGADSVPVNFLMPVPGTPLAGTTPITPVEALKSIALFRFMLPDKEIRICGGRLGTLRELHPMIFMAGANGLMMGDYLTLKGRDFGDDLRMLSDLGMRLTDE